METSTITNAIQVYFKLTKPRVWWLLVFVGVAGFLAGSSQPLEPTTLLTTVVGLISGSAGAESLANYIERDIDAKMERTRRRPLPMGLIKPPEKALILGLTLIAFSLIISALLLNIPAFLAMLLGIIDYVLIYIVLTKRRTAWNIILGSPAGAAPVFVGYAAASGTIDATALTLGLLVVLWIPSHIWSLALRYREDYIRAGIPMLPTVLPERAAVRVLAGTSLLLVTSSLILPFLSEKFFRPAYMAVAALLGAIMVALSLRVLRKPDQRSAWILFKFTSPYLALLFSAVLAESLLVLLHAH
ncbi:MAG: heme o synthase [Aigarchaeota archaeon]|nr:heme o synthase [Candidatus Calditenuaceae archaeon]